MPEALNARQILTLLKRSLSRKKLHISVAARNIDLRPSKNMKVPRAVIHNTGYLLNGIHWVLILYIKDCTLFFDSFGRSPSEVLLESSVIVKNLPILYNTQILQHSKSKVCGHWTIFYLVLLCSGYSLQKINRKFSKNLLKNDLVVFNFVKKLGEKWRVKIK